MKAAVIHSFGGKSVLEIADIPKPEARAGELLVRVRAAAINPKDTFIRKGYLKRFTGDRFPMQMGFDFAGEVEKLGDQVKDFVEGEQVFGMLDGWNGGTCAEYVSVESNQCIKKPVGISFEDAAALPLVSLTALQALRDEAKIHADVDLCINGASGGVGSMAVQIAKICQARVTAISSAGNHDFLYGLGADSCIDYHDVDITDAGKEFDVFFDVFGNQPYESIEPILRKKGIWISTVLQPHVFKSVAETRFSSSKKAKLVIVKSDRDDLKQIREWVDAGELKPIVHSVFPLERIREAHAQQETKHTRGKIVLRVS